MKRRSKCAAAMATVAKCARKSAPRKSAPRKKPVRTKAKAASSSASCRPFRVGQIVSGTNSYDGYDTDYTYRVTRATAKTATITPVGPNNAFFGDQAQTLKVHCDGGRGSYLYTGRRGVAVILRSRS